MAFNHFDDAGHAHMVDVSRKQKTQRRARAEARVQLGPALLAAVLDRDVAKGDVLGVARLAGIAAVKRTPDLIPLSHPLAIHHTSVAFETDLDTGALRIVCEVAAVERTGVEMEAITGATVAALTVYDMAKGMDKGIRIEGIRLLSKTGGKSGPYTAPAEEA
ncbi:cyclic pyranopterin monophosphate synthase MoaC [bacterium DOLZORAL124_64_63]|nr:MAG: cyclic pyranopterin monophosphate synthase MoaC [bacterium DOLZORAL124_64_63]